MSASKRMPAEYEEQGAHSANQDAEVVEIHNIRPILEKPMSWLNLIHTTPSGLRLLVRTEGDEIMDWIVHDRSGRSVPTVVYQKNGPPPAPKTCTICVTIRGETSCWDVPCDKIVILPVVAGGDESGGIVEVHDIRSILEDVPLSDGLNRIFTTPSGIQFSAEVEGGEVVEWRAYDPEGGELPTTVYQQKGPTKPPGKPAGEAIRCNVCTTQGGQTTCVQVPCDKIRILP